MEIYIEYAFLENFLYDGVLLCLALLAVKRKIVWKRIMFSAAVGGAFALLFPLLKLPNVLLNICKIAVGAFLCILAYGGLKTKKEWGRYALTTVLFFCFSFGFGGTLLGIYGFSSANDAYWSERVPSIAVFFGFSALTGVSIWLIKRLYRQKRVFKGIYSCMIMVGEKKARADGFFDSGNLVSKNGVPVCFLSTDLFYTFFEDEIFKEGRQVCNEMKIVTLSGEKKVPIFDGMIEVQNKKMQVYFAPSGNMIGKNYQVLLNAVCVGE